jgi:hypothetical protein
VEAEGKMTRQAFLLVTLFAILASASQAMAQGGYLTRQLFRENLYRQPTVSPYTELLSPTGGGISPYFNRVRPQLQQQQINRAADAGFRQLENTIEQISASSRADVRGSQAIRATGHPTRFFYYGTYYPLLNRR